MNRSLMQEVYQDFVADACEDFLAMVHEEGVGPTEATGVMLPVLAAVASRMAIQVDLMTRDEFLKAFGRVYDVIAGDVKATRQ